MTVRAALAMLALCATAHAQTPGAFNAGNGISSSAVNTMFGAKCDVAVAGCTITLPGTTGGDTLASRFGHRLDAVSDCRADPTGQSDSTSALSACVTKAASTRVPLYIPAGLYSYTGLTVVSGFGCPDIRGAGPGATILVNVSPTSDGLRLGCSGGNGGSVQDISLHAGQAYADYTGSAGTGLVVSGSNGGFVAANYEVVGYATGMLTQSDTYTRFHDFAISNAQRAAIDIGSHPAGAGDGSGIWMRDGNTTNRFFYSTYLAGTTGQTTLSLFSAQGIATGMTVSGNTVLGNTSIPAGATVTARTDASITLSQPVTAAIPAGQLLVVPGRGALRLLTGVSTGATTLQVASLALVPPQAIVSGSQIVSSGIPAGTTVTSFTAATITLSAALTGALPVRQPLLFPFNSGSIGMLIEYASGDHYTSIDNTGFFNGLVLRPSSGEYIAHVFMDRILADTSVSTGCILDSSNGSITNVEAHDAWCAFSTNGPGLVTQISSPIDDVRFLGGQFRENGWQGAILQGGNIRFVGSSFARNGKLSTLTYNGVDITANAGKYVFSAVRDGNFSSSGTWQQYNGISIAPGFTGKLQVTGSDLSEFGTGASAIANSSSVTPVTSGNLP